MQQDLQLTIALITRTPATLNSLLRDLPGEWTLRNEGEKTWCPFDVVAHLMRNDHINWLPRIRHILAHGESEPFPPFQRLSRSPEMESQTIAQVLDEFAAVRAEKLVGLRALELQTEDFSRRGLHPHLGTTTVSQLLAAWAAHDMTHLHQISRVLAHQYRDEVGPFAQFLGVLHCEGHGAA
jgi:hypothetical protein